LALLRQPYKLHFAPTKLEHLQHTFSISHQSTNIVQYTHLTHCTLLRLVAVANGHQTGHIKRPPHALHKKMSSAHTTQTVNYTYLQYVFGLGGQDGIPSTQFFGSKLLHIQSIDLATQHLFFNQGKLQNNVLTSLSLLLPWAASMSPISASSSCGFCEPVAITATTQIRTSRQHAQHRTSYRSPCAVWEQLVWVLVLVLDPFWLSLWPFFASLPLTNGTS
jgi:hypothetical protein